MPIAIGNTNTATETQENSNNNAVMMLMENGNMELQHLHNRTNSFAMDNSGLQHATSMNSAGAYQPLVTTPRAGNNIIRVINKDMTDQFRGRSKSVSQARIRWFENRKSQLLGFCLTMAFLGITIALYNYRWIGLVAGSVNTIICGSAVVLTYFQKKHWHSIRIRLSTYEPY
jgi:hypothetical protein